MAAVFLSYARADAAKAKALAAALESRSHSVWWDRVIGGGKRFSSEIEDALDKADAVVVLWSAEARISPWVQDEATIGRDSGRLVPVCLDAQPAPIGFRQFQTIDLARWSGRGAPPRIEEISRAIAGLERASTPFPAPAEVAPVTESRRRRFGPLALLVPLALIVIVAGGYWLLRGGPGEHAVPTLSIAAVPSSDQALSATLSRNLAVDLGRLQSARSDSFSLLDAPAGGNADYRILVGGSRSADSIEADLSLQSGSETLWSDATNVAPAREPDLREQIAAKAGAVTNCVIDASTSRGPPIDRPSLKMFLTACELADKGDSGAAARVTALLREVTRRNPRMAIAWAFLALAGTSEDQPDQREIRDVIAKARALDPNLGDSYAAEANLLPPGSWAKALAIIDRGIKRDPENVDLYLIRTDLLSRVGRLSEAIDSARRAYDLDPISMSARQAFMYILAYAGRADLAFRELAQAERLWPDSSSLLTTRFALNMRYGDPKEAMRALRDNPDSGLLGSRQNAVTAFLAARTDPSLRNIDAALSASDRPHEASDYQLPRLVQELVAFHRTDQAIALIQQPDAIAPFKIHSDILFRAGMEDLRRSAAFMPFAARIGLVDFWRKSNQWPDFCTDVQLPYDCHAEAAKLAGSRR